MEGSQDMLQAFRMAGVASVMDLDLDPQSLHIAVDAFAVDVPALGYAFDPQLVDVG